MTDRRDDDRRSDERCAVVLCVDYDDADDLLTDYTENLSSGGTCIAGSRTLDEGTRVQLALSFPGLLAPIHVDGVVRWARGGDEPTLGIEFDGGPAREQLSAIVERIRERDPKVMKRTLRVLVVEDNPHVAELIGHALGESRGLGPGLAVDCRTARDGREALELLRDQRFDALIVDVYLPVVDGVSVINAARKLGQIPIIAVSAGGDSAHKAAVAAGADIFIDKPMRLRNVIETMRTLMKLGESR